MADHPETYQEDTVLSDENVDVEKMPTDDPASQLGTEEAEPVTITEQALSKLQSIMKEKNLDMDSAMNYFFSLHEKTSSPAKKKGRPGRPRKSLTAGESSKAGGDGNGSSKNRETKTKKNAASADGSGDLTDEVVDKFMKTDPTLYGTEVNEGRRRSRRATRKPKTDEYAYFDVKKEHDDEDLDLDMSVSDEAVDEEREEMEEEEDPTVVVKTGSAKIGTGTEPRRPRAKRRKIDKDEFLTAQEQVDLKCSECGIQSKSKSQLIRHKWNNHNTKPRPFVCDVCGYGALYTCDLVRHKKIHSKEKTYKCEICEFSTVWPKNLDIHMHLHEEGREPWKCNICDAVIYSQQKIKQHKLSHDETALRCDVCGAAFEQLRYLNMHKVIHSKEKPFKCKHCTFSTTFKNNLRGHLWNKHKIGQPIQIKKKEFKCEQCPKVFKNEERRLVHLQIHEPTTEQTDVEKPFYCPYGCEYRSSEIDKVIKHLVIHSNEKKFKCPDCDYATKWMKDLSCHQLRHTGEKNEKCEICGYTCYTKSRLKVHMNKHNDKKEHMCTWCGQFFKHKNLLKIHTLYHTGDPQFKCEQCDFATITEARLRKHRLSHSSDRLHACDICDKNFKQAHHLNQHRDTVHLGKPNYRQRKQMTVNTQNFLSELAESVGADETIEATEDIIEPVVTREQQVIITTEDPNPNENCQYVMVHTPSGYQYVALVLPPKDSDETDGQQPSITSEQYVEPAQALQQLSQGGATMEEAQILLPQSDDDQQYVYVTIPEGEGENMSAVETLIALQP